VIYDTLTTRYTFACPEHGDTRVALSRFRQLERLPGAAHPAVFGVRFECGCGEEHPGLVSHDELDWAPLGLGTGESFLNLMTARLDALVDELADLAPSGRGDAVGLAVHCPVCGRTSINLVSEQHVDLPFHNDAEIGVVEHVFAADAAHVAEEFAAELYSAQFDARRLTLE
jgi:hypothetical protein